MNVIPQRRPNWLVVALRAVLVCFLFQTYNAIHYRFHAVDSTFGFSRRSRTLIFLSLYILHVDMYILMLFSWQGYLEVL